MWADWLKTRDLPNWDAPSHKRTKSPAYLDKYFDPATQGDVIEYARFTEWLVADGMDRFAKIVRDIIGDKKQIGSFCGYIPMQFSGKLDNSYTFNSEYINFLGNPGGYDNREIGMGGGTKTPLKSLKLTNKHYFQEVDHRTHTYNDKLSPYVSIGGIHANGARNQDETDALLKREFSLAAVMGHSLWCFDMWGGIFKTTDTMKIVKRSYEIWKKHKDDNSPYAAEVAFIADPDSGFYSKYSAYNYVKRALYSTGAPFDAILFKDIAKIDFSKYKVIVFPHSFEITPEKEAVLKEHVLKGGKTVVTMENFGSSDGKKIDPAFTERLTGFKADTKGVNKKAMQGWQSIYGSNNGAFNAKRMREIEKEAGVHLYTDEPIPAYASEKLLAVHAKNGGRKTIHLTRKYNKIVELYTGKIAGENTNEFEYDFKTPDTAALRIASMNSPENND